MSVLEMGRMLGLGKTESYWLIKKNYFKTILVGNTMRVMIDSFEEWYANQFKYQKVDGTPPGEELKKTTYSMEELGQRLGLKEATAYELVAKGHFDVVDVLGKRRVTKESFERWYASQTDYRTVEDQELDADIMASTYGLPEMARMLGVHRQTIYYIVAIDDDRRLNAERMEAAFYSGRQATPEPVQPAATESSADDKELLLKLLQNPEMAALLKSLAKTL